MKIVLSKEIGYCSGVKSAIDKAIELAKNRKEVIYTLGKIIHNEQTVDMLKKKFNIVPCESIDKIPQNATVIIRTHGIAPRELDRLKNLNASIVDLTCPFVRKTQQIAKDLDEKGYFVVILGEKRHPEIAGIAGFVASQKYKLVENEKDIEEIPPCQKVGVVFQSTTTLENFECILPVIIRKSSETRIYKTICERTINRQKYVTTLAQKSDELIIIGSKNSSNTRKLYEVAARESKKVHYVEGINDLKNVDFSNVGVVGIATGTSTSRELVEEVIADIRARY